MKTLSFLLLLASVFVCYGMEPDYAEVSLPIEAIQLCTVAENSACITPSCAVCGDIVAPAASTTNRNITLVRMGRSVYAQIPGVRADFPPFRRVDSIRLPNVIPIEFRLNSTDPEVPIAQTVVAGCGLQADSTEFGEFRWTDGQVAVYPITGTVEIALAESTAPTRLWPIVNSICGTVDSLGLTWLV